MEDPNGPTKQKLKPHPQENSYNILSALFYCWTIPIFKTGFKKELSEEDVYQTLNRHDSHDLTNRLQKAWDNQQNGNTTPSLWKALWAVFKWDLILCFSLFSFIQFVLQISLPLAFGKLMSYYAFTPTDLTKSDAILYAGIIIAVSFAQTILTNYFTMQHLQTTLKFRIACSSMIYRKSLRLSTSALAETNVGQIINLLTNDMNQLNIFLRAAFSLFTSPLQLMLVLYLIYEYCGPTALVGIVVLIILIPLQLYISKNMAGLRSKIAVRTDERMRCMNEIISGIQVIKQYGWEEPFIKLIDTLRRNEVQFIKIMNYLNSFLGSFMQFLNRTVIFICILLYVLLGNNPNAQYVFVLTLFYAILATSVSMSLPMAVSDLLKANLSVRRFERFLNLEETKLVTKSCNTVSIKVEKATASWSSKNQQNSLSNIDFEIHPNQTVAIIGLTGSGKSSLLHLFLGEMLMTGGTLEIGGKISYANQEPWLFAGTVRQNILFGQPMLPEKYKEVIRVCALEEDIAQFPHGDNSIVGERGILLSGGQKSRISLARAIYKEADIYLLDDPLSAVDASVGKQIFYDCIRGYLKEKCTVLVTHQTQYLTAVDKIYLMTNGTISVSGTYAELLGKVNFTNVIKESESTQDISHEDSAKDSSKTDNKARNVNSEARAVGKVSTMVYRNYIRATGSYSICLLILILFILCETFGLGSDYFLAFWVNLEQRRIISNYTMQDDFEDIFFTNTTGIYIYSVIIASLIIITFVRSISFVQRSMRVSIYLHDKMFTTVVKATINFFHKNSSGRVLNRFSKDIGSVDEVLPELLFKTIELTVAVLGAIISVCILSPWSLIPTLAVFILMQIIRTIYLASSVSIKRLEATNHSPIFAHVAESIKGLTTIRALDVSSILQREFDNLQNFYSSISYINVGTSRAFSIWLDVVCVSYTSIVTILTIFQESYGGNIGFIITKSMSLVGMFQYGIRCWSELENQMTSVERVVEYIELDQEKDDQVKTLPKFWAPTGKIEFKSVYLQYSSNDPYVLKQMNILIKPKEKIGIVGRTGAGKSSLISVLFRLVDFEGNIYIDDVNTKNIALSSLRSNVSIIPQDPVVFAGSVRKNLDPFEQYSDEEIWRVLKEVRLKDVVTNLTGNLYSNLSEGGTNFSVGQKQLICLARAMLKNNNILILDEATANVDPHTDELLQSTIRKNFEKCTVLTIAHRLDTIMDSDKVLVMDEGYAVEFDHPHVLLEKKEVFYSLVMKTGNVMSENLMRKADTNFKKKRE